MNHTAPSSPTDRPSRLDDRCPLCSAAELVSRHCKLLCPNCGYVESCEDLFPTTRYRCAGSEAAPVRPRD